MCNSLGMGQDLGLIVFNPGFLMSVLKVDGDTSTNDCVIALASGLSGSPMISSLSSSGARQLQACLDAVSSPVFQRTIFINLIKTNNIYTLILHVEVEYKFMLDFMSILVL